MLQISSLTKNIVTRYMFGITLSVLSIGLFWIYSSHQELLNETEILQEQAALRQMDQLQERVQHLLDMIDYERRALDGNMRNQIRQRTLEAHAMMENIYQNSRSDHTNEQIADIVRHSLRAIKYNDNRGYFFATKLDGIEQLFPPNPKLEGTSFLNISDLNGKLVVQDMIKLVKKQGEGFYEYTWTKPGRQGQHRKIAYIKYFEPLDWFVGTGEYIDDLTSDLQNEIINRIEKIKFKGGGYGFAADYNGISLSYPAKGRNMYQLQDSNGLKLVQEMIKLAQAGGGFLRYVMPPLEGQRPEPKISYVAGVPEWQWYIGSGDFVADLDQQLAAMLAQQKATIRDKMLTILASLIVFLLFGIILSRQLGRQVHSSFQIFQDFFARAASQAEPLSVSDQSFTEFENLAESANRMLEERQRFERKANDYRDRLQSVIDAMPSILVTIDPLGQISQWNKFAAEKTGISQTEAIGQELTNLLPYLQPYLTGILATTCEKQQVFQVDVEIAHTDEVRFKDISAYPLGIPRPHSVVVRVDDITERKILERTLVQSEKMLSVGGLAAGMAHEVNNPLSAIMQNLYLVQSRVSAENPKTRQLAAEAGLDLDALQKFWAAGGVPNKVDNAIFSCRRAATIVKNMLNFSRDGQSDFSATDLKQLINSTLELLDNDYDFQQKYDFREVRIKRSFAEAMPEVVCEASKIQQVIFNLLKNGTQAMALANIPFDKRRFELEVFQKNDMAVIRISDSGPGIPESVRMRIFEPFFTTKDVGSGTGLGLFVAYFIIHDNHGGDINVDSIPGQGTTFTIKLPINQTIA